MVKEWNTTGTDPNFRMAESRATTRAELQEDIGDFWLQVLALDADEITISIDVVDGVLEAPNSEHVLLRLTAPLIRHDYGMNPYNPEMEPEEYDRHDYEMHREMSNMVREAFQRPDVLQVYQTRRRVLATQHRWSEPDTKFLLTF